MVDDPRLISIKAYYDGVKEGVRLYAHWKDGEQYVGTCGKTLKSALDNISEEELLAINNIYNRDIINE